jgi:hypothetical protein
MLDPARPIEAHLPDSCVIDDPVTFFELFLGDKQYDLMVRNTNKYAEVYLTLYPRNSTRPFKPTCRQEIKVYIALLIYIDIHRHNNPKSHWEHPAKRSPVYYITWKRYEHMKTIFKVSNINQDREHADVPGDWHFKLSPLDNHLQERF